MEMAGSCGLKVRFVFWRGRTGELGLWFLVGGMGRWMDGRWMEPLCVGGEEYPWGWMELRSAWSFVRKGRRESGGVVLGRALPSSSVEFGVCSVGDLAGLRVCGLSVWLVATSL